MTTPPVIEPPTNGSTASKPAEVQPVVPVEQKHDGISLHNIIKQVLRSDQQHK